MKSLQQLGPFLITFRPAVFAVSRNDTSVLYIQGHSFFFYIVPYIYKKSPPSFCVTMCVIHQTGQVARPCCLIDFSLDCVQVHTHTTHCWANDLQQCIIYTYKLYILISIEKFDHLLKIHERQNKSESTASHNFLILKKKKCLCVTGIIEFKQTGVSPMCTFHKQPQVDY